MTMAPRSSAGPITSSTSSARAAANRAASAQGEIPFPVRSSSRTRSPSGVPPGSRVGTSVERPDYDAEVNVLGTVRVLEAARVHGTHVVFSSTGGAIYGECDGPAAEGAPRRPISPYGISKLAGEEYVAGWNRLFGTSHVSLRFANVFGPRQEASLEGGVIAIFLERLAAGEETTIFGDGEQTRDFIYVGDVVHGVLAAAGHAGGVYNLGTGVETSINELHAVCRRVTGV